MIQIKFKDIDPDTGTKIQEKVIATCETTEQAKWLIEALYKHSEEPNRDFFRDVVIDMPTEAQKTSSKKKKQSSEESIQKAKEIDEEIRRQAGIAELEKQNETQKKAKELEDETRRQAVLKYQEEYREKQKANQETNKKKNKPSNNGYVPYDQFKFE